ncbi:MAG TPA: hypothetical protein VK104_08420 [Burkholderiaceae bacterium]|nr:hypothetical protein [Burkholderiaceae bacterium]
MKTDTPPDVMKVILHAPTPAALERARNNAMNLKRDVPDADVRIIVNAEAVGRAQDVVHPEMDAFTWVCPNTLARTSRDNRPPLQVLDHAAIFEIVGLQHKGWVYIRS